MLWRFFPVQWWKAWGAIVSASAISLLLLVSGDNWQLAIVRGLRNTILYPVSAMDTVAQDMWRVRGENERLRLELAKARLAASRLKEVRLENDRLAAMLAFRAERDDLLIAAKVVGRGQHPTRDWSYLSIQAELPAGLEEREIVAIAPDGLVGRLVEREFGSLIVRTLASPRSAVHVLSRRTRVSGVVRSSGGVGSLFRVEHVPSQAELAPGDTLVTSGQGQVFPPGIPVGSVVQIARPPDELIMDVWMTPFVDFSRLEEVFLSPGKARQP